MKNILTNTRAVLDKKEKKKFAVLVLLDVMLSIVDILSLALLLWIIQFYIQPANSRQLHFLPAWLADNNSLGFIGLFVLVFGLKNACAYFIAEAWYKFIGDVAVRISRNSLVNYQQAGYEEFVNTDSSTHIRKIALRPFEFCQYILSGMQQVITQSILILLAIAAIVIFNAQLFLLLLAILLPPVVAIFFFIRRRLINARNDIKSGNEKSYQYLLDALKGWVESNVYDRNDFFLHRFTSTRRKFSKSLFESISIQNLPPRIIEVFAVLGLFILIAIAKWSGNNNTQTWITIGAFMAAAYKIIPGIVKIINVTGQMRAYGFSAGDLAESVHKDRNIGNNAAETGLDSLRFRNISFRYGNQKILENLSFDIERGDFIGITGKSGKGKTTILNLLLGFLQPANGEILVNGNAVNKEEIKSYWPYISYVRQQPFFIHDSILRNITLEEEGYNKANLNYSLKVSGLNAFIAGIPEGLDKIITENGKNISGGQQQRIAIARALYKNAGLVLLDEPFNELDEPSVESMLEYFRNLAQQGKMIVLITHDKKSLAWCNKIISADVQESENIGHSYSRVS